MKNISRYAFLARALCMMIFIYTLSIFPSAFAQNASANFYSVTYSDPQTAFIVGDNALFARSTDGGATWLVTHLPGITTSFRDIRFIDSRSWFYCRYKRHVAPID